jgi:hypothetical protein
MQFSNSLQEKDCNSHFENFQVKVKTGDKEFFSSTSTSLKLELPGKRGDS